MKKNVPVFVIAGHPNEGKSSVLSTLAEDDSVRISPVPGETRECRAFPVKIDNTEIIRFIDTPGFQNPRRTLRWMQSYTGPDENMISEFIKAHRSDPAFRDDCELLTPMISAAGIIFVVDGSRPVRATDRAEMEILRLTGKPRMAVINCKHDETAWLSQWQQEFRKHFNSIRIFNSFSATYSRRMELLESLRVIDQDLAATLDTVIRAIREDWRARREQSAEIITRLIHDVISFQTEAEIPDGRDKAAAKAVRQQLLKKYQAFVEKAETQAYKRIRNLYRHNVFDCSLPEHSILQEDIFSEKTWEFLGLSRKQLVIAGALGGAVAGAAVDLGHGGLSMGLFSAAGGIIGAAGTALKGRDLLSGRRILGIRLDRHRLRLGPASNIQLLYILIDRALIYYQYILTWAHGRRDYENAPVPVADSVEHGFTRGWDRSRRNICENFFDSVVRDRKGGENHAEEMAFTAMIEDCLDEISG